MVDFPVSNSEFSSEFRWVETETHVHAWYGHSDRVFRVHAYEKGTLEGQNIQIHITNLLALEKIKEGFDVSSRRWGVATIGAFGFFAFWEIFAIATININYTLLGTACGYTLLGTACGMSVVAISICSWRYMKYKSKSKALLLAQRALSQFFENRFCDYLKRNDPERIAFKNYFYILSDSRFTDWPGALINRNNYYKVFSEEEHQRIYCVLNQLPEELLPPAPAPQVPAETCALGTNACAHKPECLVLRQAPASS